MKKKLSKITKTIKLNHSYMIIINKGEFWWDPKLCLARTVLL